MALAPKLGLRTAQHLAMTPLLQQAIRLLQMNNTELSDFLAAEVERNPLLMFADSEPSVGLGGNSNLRAFENRINGGASLDLSFAEDFVQAETLTGHLTAQLGLAVLPNAIAEIASRIINELGDDGYFRTPLTELAIRVDRSVEIVEKALAVVQSFSPTGIAARNLGECLTLQLIEMGRLDAPMKVLIENIQRIAHHETKELCNLTGCDAIEIKRRLQVIRKLDPRPGDQFRNQSPSTKTPDIIVTANSQLGWHIEIATDNLPKILVNNLYIQEINDSGSGASKSMIEMSNQANWLVRSLDLRIKTLLKVATSIVRYQDGFFRLGIDGLRPMTLRTIASDLAMHESSISRATTGKYFACDRGIFELKSLFSRAISATENLTPHAAASVRNRVARIIATEISGKKLTDARIVEILKSEGVLIARRTVAKYRLAQRIPHSARRHFKLTVGNAN